MIDYTDDFSEPYKYEEANPDDIFATILYDELVELIEDSKMLMCLMTAGVSQWDGFEGALTKYKEEIKHGTAFFLKSDPE